MSEKTKFGTQLIGVWFFIGLMTISIIIFAILGIHEIDNSLLYYISISVFLILLVIAIISLIRINKAAKSYREFLKNGTLIKDLTFVKHKLIEKTSSETNESKFIAVVDYKTKDGKTITIGSEYPLESTKYGNRETVDLYIDENNLKNYIIDFDLEDKIKNNELY